MREESGFLKVTNHLEAQIAGGTLSPGMKIPSLRKLGHDFNLSVGTIRRSINHLKEKGVLITSHGSGVYVASKRKSAENKKKKNSKYRISVFIRSDNLNNSYCAHALQGAQSSATSQYSLICHFSDYYSMQNSQQRMDFSQLEEAAAESDALLFIGSYDSIIDRLPLTKPCVGIELYNSYNGLMSIISLDPFNAASIAKKYFISRNYKKIKILTSNQEQVYNSRIEIFCNHWGDPSSVEIIHKEELTPDLLEDDECAYFFISDTEFDRLAKKFKESTGKILIEERCTLSIDGKSLILPNCEPINTIAVNWNEMGAIALEECIRRIENPGANSRRIYQNCFLKEYRN
jgi:DNA-binding transcriptional regulator YhcF (GntR family)